MNKLVLIFLLLLTSCTYNVEYVKSIAPEFFNKSGYEIVMYEGYEGAFSICGGDVWYQFKRPGSPIIYNAYLCKWGNEIHLYSIKALNGIGNHE